MRLRARCSCARHGVRWWSRGATETAETSSFLAAVRPSGYPCRQMVGAHGRALLVCAVSCRRGRGRRLNRSRRRQGGLRGVRVPECLWVAARAPVRVRCPSSLACAHIRLRHRAKARWVPPALTRTSRLDGVVRQHTSVRRCFAAPAVRQNDVHRRDGAQGSVQPGCAQQVALHGARRVSLSRHPTSFMSQACACCACVRVRTVGRAGGSKGSARCSTESSRRTTREVRCTLM